MVASQSSHGERGGKQFCIVLCSPASFQRLARCVLCCIAWHELMASASNFTMLITFFNSTIKTISPAN